VFQTSSASLMSMGLSTTLAKNKNNEDNNLSLNNSSKGLSESPSGKKKHIKK